MLYFFTNFYFLFFVGSICYPNIYYRAFSYNNQFGVDNNAYMTDNEFQNLMDEVLRIVKESESKDEAVEKLQGLIENKNSIF